MLTRLSDNLLKLEHHTGLKKNWADELQRLVTTNVALHLVFTKESELNDEDIFPQVCINVFWKATYFYTV